MDFYGNFIGKLNINGKFVNAKEAFKNGTILLQ